MKLIPLFIFLLVQIPVTATVQYLMEFQFTDSNQKSETWLCRALRGSNCQIQASSEQLLLNVHARVIETDGVLAVEYFFEHVNHSTRSNLKAQGQVLVKQGQPDLLQQSAFGTLRLKFQQEVIDPKSLVPAGPGKS